MFGKSFKFFGPPPTKWRSFKFFAKLNANHILMANFFKLRKYQTFGFIELHNLSKGQLADGIFKLWKSSVYDYRADLRLRLPIIWLFKFCNFQTTFVKNFMKKLPGFKMYFESTYKILPLYQYFCSKISRQWNNSPLIFFFFWNLQGRALRFLNFAKWEKY